MSGIEIIMLILLIALIVSNTLQWFVIEGLRIIIFHYIKDIKEKNEGEEAADQ